MVDLVILLTYVGFIAAGTLAPFVLTLGYVWVDSFSPHRVSYSLLTNIPAAFIMGAAAVVFYVLFDRRNPPKITVLTWLPVVIATWITLTLIWAVAPAAAYVKWDVSVKTVLFTAFIPFAIRSRTQIEAFLLVYLMSMAGHLLPWGLKTILGGGGYNVQLGILGINESYLSESSGIATVAIMQAPLLLALRKHSLLIPSQRVRDLLFFGLMLLLLFASIGTYARTGLVGFAVLGVALMLRTRRKVLFGFVSSIIVAALYAATSASWVERISTVADYQTESSALTRTLVWRWTLDFVASNPLGGGFNSYLINRIEAPGINGSEGLVQFGRAFHSIYFALLGEHGIPGLVLYLLMILFSLLALRTSIRLTRGIPEQEWAYDLAKALQISMAVVFACGAFIDISFQPLVWYLFSLATCIREYVRRAVVMPVPATRFIQSVAQPANRKPRAIA